jgi:hypothetical protein
MKKIRIHRHPRCPRCARLAALHRRFDWLDRIDDSTAAPPARAPLRLGEIAVQDLRTGALLEGVAAVRAIARQVPLYWPLVPLLWLPPIARRADADARGCDSS